MSPGGVTIRFYGVRGSIPVPGPSTVRVGGNTSCVVYRADDQLIILDCGSGMRVLARELARSAEPIKATVLMSHYHWDHMIGLPFFTPIYSPSTELGFFGERKGKLGPEEEAKKQFSGPNFPVEQKDLRSILTFNEIKPGDVFELGRTKITTFRLNHPNLCLGYRLQRGDTAVVYTTDHEHGTELDEQLIDMAQGASCLIYDAMYTADEYQARARGWGHSTWEEGVRVATAAQIEHLFLFHHEPERDDDAVDAIEAEATRRFRGAVAAREGYEYKF